MKGGESMYEGFHTTEDVMREYLIQVANLDEYGVPELYPIMYRLWMIRLILANLLIAG